MRFLADESVHGRLVRALRSEGHDVVAITERRPGADDPNVAEIAFADDRILLTQDSDFGELIFVERRAAHGVVFMRYPPRVRVAFVREVTAIIAREGERLLGKFVVVSPGRFRSTPLPTGSP